MDDILIYDSEKHNNNNPQLNNPDQIDNHSNFLSVYDQNIAN